MWTRWRPQDVGPNWRQKAWKWGGRRVRSRSSLEAQLWRKFDIRRTKKPELWRHSGATQKTQGRRLSFSCLFEGLHKTIHKYSKTVRLQVCWTFCNRKSMSIKAGLQELWSDNRREHHWWRNMRSNHCCFAQEVLIYSLCTWGLQYRFEGNLIGTYESNYSKR